MHARELNGTQLQFYIPIIQAFILKLFYGHEVNTILLHFIWLISIFESIQERNSDVR